MKDDGFTIGYLTGICVGGVLVYVFCRYVLFPPRPVSPLVTPPMTPRPFVVTPEAVAFHDEMHARKVKK